jgi:hypothetical protein
MTSNLILIADVLESLWSCPARRLSDAYKGTRARRDAKIESPCDFTTEQHSIDRGEMRQEAMTLIRLAKQKVGDIQTKTERRTNTQAKNTKQRNMIR